MITITVSGEMGCGKSTIVDRIVKSLQKNYKGEYQFFITENNVHKYDGNGRRHVGINILNGDNLTPPPPPKPNRITSPEPDRGSRNYSEETPRCDKCEHCEKTEIHGGGIIAVCPPQGWCGCADCHGSDECYKLYEEKK